MEIKSNTKIFSSPKRIPTLWEVFVGIGAMAILLGGGYGCCSDLSKFW